MINSKIKPVKKEEFLLFKDSVSHYQLNASDTCLIEIFNEFIEEYEDDEIDVCGLYDESNRLIGLIRFSEEEVSFLFGNEEGKCDDEDEILTLIGAILVHPAYKGKGIGRKLVDYAISQADTEWIVADPFEEKASGFFMSLDFEYDKERRFVKDNNEWCLFFQKSL